jgi:hypothetical protein
VSPQPVAPTRIVILATALFFALGAGIAASFVASEVLAIIQDARALRELAKRPILGMVSMLPSESFIRLRRRNAYLFAGGLGGLVVGFSAFFLFVALAVRVA